MKPFRMLLSCLPVFCVALAGAAEAGRIEEYLTSNAAKMWSVKSAEAAAFFKGMARPAGGGTVRYYAKTGRGSLEFRGVAVTEMLLLFDEQDQLREFRLIVWNRGDAKEAIGEKEFDGLSLRCREFLGELLPESEETRQRINLPGGLIEGFFRKTPKGDYVLKVSRSKAGAEFIILQIYPSGKAESLRGSVKAESSRRENVARVETLPGGGRKLNVPMVDQGRKGYCVAATLERVMRYYGAEVDQNMVAQIAGSDGNMGTNMDNLLQALNKAGGKLGIRSRVIVEDTTFKTISTYEKFSQNYNSAARKTRKKKLNFNSFLDGNTLNFGDMIDSIDPDTFVRARCDEAKAPRNFVRRVQSAINNGVPLCWVTLILPSERGGGNFSVHMRLIVGYDPANRQLLYSDSWGRGHELKTMPYEKGWALTLWLIEVSAR